MGDFLGIGNLFGNMTVGDRPITPPNQGTRARNAGPNRTKKAKPHQFSPHFKGKKLDGKYGTGQPPDIAGGRKRRRRRKSRRKSKRRRKSRRRRRRR